MRKSDTVDIGLREDLVARLARRGFQAFAGLGDANFHDGQRHGPLLAKLAAKGGPCICVGTEAVMNVNRANTGARAHLVKEDYRIDTARQPYGDALLSAPRLP